jgi:phosphoenolpyruvate carboxylase
VSYQVGWKEEALQELAAIWITASDQKAVSVATDEIDVVLELFPNSAGRSVFDTVREYTNSPLVVEFEVDDLKRTVTVISVWGLAKGRPPLTGN